MVKITKKRVVNTIIFCIVCSVILFGGLGLLYWAEEQGYITAWFEWLQSIGIYGNLIIALVFVPTSFPLIPGYAILTVACGFLFGFKMGVVTVIVGSQLGILAVYLVVKFLLKKRTERVRLASTFFLIVFKLILVFFLVY